MSHMPPPDLKLPPEIGINWADVPSYIEVPSHTETDAINSRPFVIPPLPEINIELPPISLPALGTCKDRPLDMPRFTTWTIRHRIVDILSGDSFIPKYIGSPSWSEIKSVRHQVICEMAYRYWEIEGRPDGKNLQHWYMAAEDWNNALKEVWI